MELACQSILTVLMNFGFLVFGVTDYVSRDMTLTTGPSRPTEAAAARVNVNAVCPTNPAR